MQDMRGIGRELKAGADFFEHVRLLEHGDAKACARQRQRRVSPAMPAPATIT